MPCHVMAWHGTENSARCRVSPKTAHASCTTLTKRRKDIVVQCYCPGWQLAFAGPRTRGGKRQIDAGVQPRSMYAARQGGWAVVTSHLFAVMGFICTKARGGRPTTQLHRVLLLVQPHAARSHRRPSRPAHGRPQCVSPCDASKQARQARQASCSAAASRHAVPRVRRLLCLSCPVLSFPG